jgi:hypothetical protein
MLEALLFAAAVAATPAPPAKSAEAPPTAELLEFIGDWDDDEAARFLDPKEAQRKLTRGDDATRRDQPAEKDDDR